MEYKCQKLPKKIRVTSKKKQHFAREDEYQEVKQKHERYPFILLIN